MHKTRFRRNLLQLTDSLMVVVRFRALLPWMWSWFGGRWRCRPVHDFSPRAQSPWHCGWWPPRHQVNPCNRRMSRPPPHTLHYHYCPRPFDVRWCGSCRTCRRRIGAACFCCFSSLFSPLRYVPRTIFRRLPASTIWFGTRGWSVWRYAVGCPATGFGAGTTTCRCLKVQ